MNHYLNYLEPYPFAKLAKLKQGITPPANQSPINMSIGEPKHPSPEFITRVLNENRAGFSSYPTTIGTIELRQAIVDWLNKRFHIKAGVLDPEKNVLPVNGTREALFAACQSIVDSSPDALVLMPNPFYQIYEGAALLAGAKPYYINLDQSTLLPDFASVPAEIWQRCQLLFICSPNNPTGAVMNIKQMTELISLADRYDFIIASDECYSEIYFDETNPPVGLLQASNSINRQDFARCLVFHSLSKRSSLPGMRSGFVAGDAQLIEKFLLYRTYHGCAMPLPTQAASIIAWQDEKHVKENRQLYRQKFATAMDMLSPVTEISMPEGGFYLWFKTPFEDTQFAQQLYGQYNLTVMPGSFLSRTANDTNPGAKRLRIALVSAVEECNEAIKRLQSFVTQIKEPA